TPGRNTKVSPSRVWNSRVPDNVITYWGSGSGCQSYEECAGVSLKWIATPSARPFRSIVPSSTCDALSGPVYNLNARIPAPVHAPLDAAAVPTSTRVLTPVVAAATPTAPARRRSRLPTGSD